MSPTGQRAIHHEAGGSRVLPYRCAEAFGYVREQRRVDGRPGGVTEPFRCLGFATYESHEGERIWSVAGHRREKALVNIRKASSLWLEVEAQEVPENRRSSTPQRHGQRHHGHVPSGFSLAGAPGRQQLAHLGM